MQNRGYRAYHKHAQFGLLALAAVLTTFAFTGSARSGALLSGPLTRHPGNPLLRNGPEPYDLGKTGPRVVLKLAPGRYRMWYEAVAGNGLTAVAYATSADGTTWTKQGVVLSPTAPWEKEEVSPNSVLFEGGVYKLWYHGGGYIRDKKRLGNAMIGYATSRDGVTWAKLPTNPVLNIGSPGSFDDIQVAEPRVIRFDKVYRMYYTGQRASDEKTSLGMATSADGIHWSKYGRNPILDAAQCCGFWGGAFLRGNGIWHLWHAAGNSGKSGLYYMWSRDGITWNDGPKDPVLAQNPDPKAPDHGLVGDSVSGYRDGRTYRIMYTGFNANLFGSLGRFEGICLAWLEVEKTN